jgi:hypothetical protein
LSYSDLKASYGPPSLTYLLSHAVAEKFTLHIEYDRRFEKLLAEKQKAAGRSDVPLVLSVI